MINNRFLHYKTNSAFLEDLDLYGELAMHDKIVFIADTKQIWTHGNFYGIVVADSQLSNTSTNPVQNKVIKIAIDNLNTICLQLQTTINGINNVINTDIEAVANKFAQVEQFLESISDSELYGIISQIISLQEQINQLSGSGTISSDGIKHTILTQAEYNNLTEYENNTIYFIVNQTENTWTFGGEFPITFGTIFTFGGTFPITLT